MALKNASQVMECSYKPCVVTHGAAHHCSALTCKTEVVPHTSQCLKGCYKAKIHQLNYITCLPSQPTTGPGHENLPQNTPAPQLARCTRARACSTRSSPALAQHTPQSI